ncbi:MAG: DNA polymerase III subunit delta [Oscillospiraceae bacterium]|nr:DNA polymerase III subunit delta [Oscillospiraceae bacterium]
MGKDNTYIIYGSDSYLKSKFVEDLLREINIQQPCNLTTFKEDFKLYEIIDATQTIPFAEKKRCVLVYDFAWENLNKKEVASFLAFLANVSDQSYLVFLRTENKLNATATRLLSSFEEFVTLKELNAMAEPALVNFVVSKFEAKGIKISRTHASTLVSLCSHDLHFIMLEISKLCAYTSAFKKDALEQSDIDLMIKTNLEQSAFEISKAIVQGNLKLAHQTLSGMMKNNEPPSLIVAAVSSLFIDLLRAKIASLCKVAPETVLTDFADVYKNKMFRIQNAYRLASKHSLNSIIRCIDILSTLDVYLKNNSDDSQTSIQEALCRIHMCLT